jgi:hypothetical protein
MTKIIREIFPSKNPKGEWVNPAFPIWDKRTWPEYFGPDNFEIGKKYRIELPRYKHENKSEYREGIVTRNNVINTNNARALEIIVEEKLKGKPRKVRRKYSYYRMRIAFELDN